MPDGYSGYNGSNNGSGWVNNDPSNVSGGSGTSTPSGNDPNNNGSGIDNFLSENPFIWWPFAMVFIGLLFLVRWLKNRRS